MVIGWFGMSPAIYVTSTRRIGQANDNLIKKLISNGTGNREKGGDLYILQISIIFTPSKFKDLDE